MATGGRGESGAVAGGLALLLAASVGVVAWCAIGRLEETPGAGQELDFRFEAPEVDRSIEAIVGVGAALVAVGIGVALWRRRAGGGAAAPGLAIGAIGTAALAGVTLGGSGRLMTAGSVGANIGGGIAMLVGLPVAAVLAVAAVIVAALATRHPS